MSSISTAEEPASFSWQISWVGSDSRLLSALLLKWDSGFSSQNLPMARNRFQSSFRVSLEVLLLGSRLESFIAFQRPRKRCAWRGLTSSPFIDIIATSPSPHSGLLLGAWSSWHTLRVVGRKAYLHSFYKCCALVGATTLLPLWYPGTNEITPELKPSRGERPALTSSDTLLCLKGARVTSSKVQEHKKPQPLITGAWK